MMTLILTSEIILPDAKGLAKGLGKILLPLSGGSGDAKRGGGGEAAREELRVRRRGVLIAGMVIHGGTGMGLKR